MEFEGSHVEIEEGVDLRAPSGVIGVQGFILAVHGDQIREDGSIVNMNYHLFAAQTCNGQSAYIFISNISSDITVGSDV